jgi:hypothetical protein
MPVAEQYQAQCAGHMHDAVRYTADAGHRPKVLREQFWLRCRYTGLRFR